MIRAIIVGLPDSFGVLVQPIRDNLVGLWEHQRGTVVRVRCREPRAHDEQGKDRKDRTGQRITGHGVPSAWGDMGIAPRGIYGKGDAVPTEKPSPM
jgi:hypothetical protein